MTKNKLRNFFSVVILLLSLNANNLLAHADEHQRKTDPLFSGLESAAAQVVTKFHDALKNGDQKLAKSLLADDVLIYEGEGVERSLEEYAGHHLPADIEYLSGLKQKLLEHQVKQVGDMAYSTSRSLMTGEYKGKAVNTNSTETMVLIKVKGEWKISHIHW